MVHPRNRKTCSGGDVITYDELRAKFEYDPLTGHLMRNGKSVGTRHSLGYLKVKINKRTYFVHRLIFLYCHGRWPIRIDHKNRDKTDNRLCNLHECSHELNNANRGIMRSNTSGFKGVHLVSATGRWRAQVGYEVIGHYSTREEAASAYDAVAVERYGENALTNKTLGLL